MLVFRGVKKNIHENKGQHSLNDLRFKVWVAIFLHHLRIAIKKSRVTKLYELQGRKKHLPPGTILSPGSSLHAAEEAFFAVTSYMPHHWRNLFTCKNKTGIIRLPILGRSNTAHLWWFRGNLPCNSATLWLFNISHAQSMGRLYIYLPTFTIKINHSCKVNIRSPWDNDPWNIYCFFLHLPFPKFNFTPEKLPPQSERTVFQPSFFRGELWNFGWVTFFNYAHLKSWRHFLFIYPFTILHGTHIGPTLSFSYQGWGMVINPILVLFASFYGFYHGQSPINHHLWDFFLLHFSNHLKQI